MAAIFSFLGRVMLCTIFFLSAVAQKIPKFDETLAAVDRANVPQPKMALLVAIVVLIVGSVSVIIGYKARFGALLLLLFLAAASFFFHAFWKEDQESAAYINQMIQFQKNLALAGAMVFIMANGSGRGSIDPPGDLA